MPRIEEVAPMRLIEKFSACELTDDGTALLLRLGDDDYTLTRSEAAALRDQLSEELCHRRPFLRTAGEYREDGRYVVERRHADSAGHRKVFESFGELERLYERLPETFTAEDVGQTGLTGGRRHMLVHHVAEHPAFECSLVSRQPLTVEKMTTGRVDTNGPPAGSGSQSETPAGGNSEPSSDDEQPTGEVLPAD